MIFAIALSSNHQQYNYFDFVYSQLKQLGQVEFSSVYLIPCRDHIGDDYWNSACLLMCSLSLKQMIKLTKDWENQANRIRPSHQISLDVDIIAYGDQLDNMQFITQKLPLPLDVTIPLKELWQHPYLFGEYKYFPKVDYHHLD